MKHSFYLIILLLMMGCAEPSTTHANEEKPEVTTFILVRHAEKADDGTSDPPLTATGKARAELLAQILTKIDVSVIYSTPYLRTVGTVQPTADMQSRKVIEYDAGKPVDELLGGIIKKHVGGTILISGHSNTIPVMLNVLGGSDQYKQFEDSEYENLFVVTAEEPGKGTVVNLTINP